ncbi:NADH dehydrogenase (ubiquinone) Fe-S protein [Acrasis kona]|uniref:NADH dehydrogenase (Ubiquinone) Fe-S protein n=1 Tax=Acrasis kona TaxID=1008807 RepID=A0AAW2YN16_9EUKA
MSKAFQFVKYVAQLTPKYVSNSFHREFYYLHTQPKYLVQLMHVLNLHHNYQFKMFMDLAAIDYPANRDRFQVVYNLLSTLYANRLFVKVNNNETDSLPSLTFKYPSANWYEREAFDMFGIHFSNNNDLRRILTDYGFSGHPLRKDFPMHGFTEVAYSERRKTVIYKPISLVQNYRNYDTLTPWNYFHDFDIPSQV